MEFRDCAPRDGSWLVRRDKVTMLLELPNSVEKLWKQLGSKIRAQVKRPEREDAETVAGGVELLDDFYKVFSRNMRDLGTPVYPQNFFAKVLRAVPETSGIVLVRLRGEPAAAGLLIGSGERVEVPWASSLRKFNSTGVNMLLYWEMLKAGIERGYDLFDFGRCTENSGTYHFKKQWGAEEKEVPWAYWFYEERDSMPGLASGLGMRLAVLVWSKIPLPIANWLGPKISPSLPW